MKKFFLILFSLFLYHSCTLAPATTTVDQTTTVKVCPPQPQESWTSSLSTLIETSTSLWLQLLLVFCLGLLMSLTPCIYPMIPVTVGVLQAQGSKSLLNNFLLALAYTLGIATTFSVLGLLAAFSGQVFGSLLTNPWVIIPVVLLLVYSAGSMLGLYEMYIPRWMQANKVETRTQYAWLSAYLFGLVSGTVASPCLSPGLIFLLSVVTALANKLLGFLMLFVFGIGLSIPLLFIGTFSGSIALLPRAGLWMVEVKRLLGLVLVGMCFYFLANITPEYILLWLASITSLVLGIFYVYITKKQDAPVWRALKSIVGIGLIVGAVILSARAYQATYHQPIAINQDCWITDYAAAHAQALEQNKKLFIDVGAPCCSVCHAIDAKFFTDQTVLAALNNCILLKIDGSDTSNSSTVAVLNTYKVIGFPTLLLVDPVSNSILARWNAELYDKSQQEFIGEIMELLNRSPAVPDVALAKTGA